VNTVRLHIVEMRQLRQALQTARNARVRVGVLGNKADRFDDAGSKQKLNNPSLGLTHEFGSMTRNIPARSFLRMPLRTRLPARMEQIGRAFWRAMILKRGPLYALRALGVEAENIVQEAFETGGFGHWPKWSPRYARWRAAYERARSKLVGPLRPGSLLILSAQLRRAITSRVEPGKP
jgi:hypothetical protein